MVRLLIGLLTVLVSQLSFALTNVTATVDKNPVMVKESLILQVVADDDVETNALDTSVLIKDFIVGRTSVSSQTSMINFDTTRTTTWTTVLIPRRAGKITIPALTIDSVQTAPIELTVSEGSQQASGQQDIFITSNISSRDVYVQQQMTLTVTLHIAAELKRASLSEPQMANANITQISKDKESDKIINGRRYRVIERNYAVNPQKSGEFTISAPVFSGEVIVPSTRRSNFLSFAETKPVSILGDDISVKVRPIPPSYQGAWLPSELLAIHEEWQPQPEEFIVGEPITRTITITAAGLSEEQLPDIEMKMPQGLKLYPDQAELHTGMNNNKLVSQKVRNFALVASKAGTYQLPEIIVPWWNTVTNKYQKAIIPAQTITVKLNPEFVAEPTPTQSTNNTPIQTAPNNVVVTQASWLQWLFLTLWLATSIAWFISSRLAKSDKTEKVLPEQGQQKKYLTLMAACKQNNGEQALQLFLPWVNSLKVSATPLNTIGDALRILNDEGISNAVNDLQQCYFGKNSSNWQGSTLLAAITQYNKASASEGEPALSLNP